MWWKTKGTAINVTLNDFYASDFARMYLCSAAASGWAGWALAHPEFGSSVNPIITRGGGQIMPTTLLLAHPDLKTQRQLCTVAHTFDCVCSKINKS